MGNQDRDWRGLLEAARRQIDIASYHEEKLSEILSSLTGGPSEKPPVPVQAHFEGCVLAVIAATEKVADAWDASHGRKRYRNITKEAFEAMGVAVPDLRSWLNEPLQEDLRNIRNAMAHYSYVKTPHAGTPRWVIQKTTSRYDGPRELEAYAKSASGRGRVLGKFLPRVERALESGR